MDGQSIVKLQSNQFLIHPITHTQTVFGDSKQFEVDLSRQSCECSDFIEKRSDFPIGDPRRFCKHMVACRIEYLDDLHPFMQSLLQACELNNSGLPNGNSFAFFEVEGRLGFFGENRDQTAYFFVSGTSPAGEFHEFTYDRSNKNWAGGVIPDAPETLLGFAFKERGKYVTDAPPTAPIPDASIARTRRERQRGRPEDRETSSVLKVLVFLLAAAGLLAGGYFLFKDGTPEWLGGEKEVAEKPNEPVLPTANEQMEKNKKDAPPVVMPPPLTGEADGGKSNSSFNSKDKADDEKDDDSKRPKGAPSTIEDQQPKPSELEFRQWKTADETFSVFAKYKSFMNGQVTLVREDTGEEIKVDQGTLRVVDRDYISKVRRERRLQKARENSGN